MEIQVVIMKLFVLVLFSSSLQIHVDNSRYSYIYPEIEFETVKKRIF